jgi:hypothetical protein
MLERVGGRVNRAVGAKSAEKKKERSGLTLMVGSGQMKVPQMKDKFIFEEKHPALYGHR